MNAETQERVRQLPYHHSFERYFELNGQTIDRLALILEHGILSPNLAEIKGIPYKRLPIEVIGLPDYYDVVFLYSTGQRSGLAVPGGISLLFDESIKTITPQEMQRINPCWPVSSIGEVYVREKIDPREIKEVRIRRGDKMEVEKMLERFQLTAKVS